MKTTIVLGDINLDIILSDLQHMPSFGREIEARGCTMKPGGSAANVAMMLALNDCPVRFFGQVGHDRAGAFIADELRTAGLSTDTLIFSNQKPTGLTVSLTYPNDRMYITYPGITEMMNLEGLCDSYIQDGAHLHLASYFLLKNFRGQMGGLLKRAKEEGMSTSFDPGGDPAGEWDLGDLEGYLHYIDYFLPNADEMMGITGCSDIREALRGFFESVRCIVVKAGAGGAIGRLDGNIDCFPQCAVDVIDTTCAGDCFDAGFLYGLTRGEAFTRCVQWGNFFGAQAVSTLGLPAQKIDDFLSSMKGETEPEVEN
jgi:sugar/nucleoside kinase (ribokinase family)